MIDEKLIIRDFIYLDWERIRSISSQLFQGIPNETKTETTNQKEIHAKGTIGLDKIIPFIPLGVEAGGDIRFYQTKSETRSLHHHIYAQVETSLIDNNMIQAIDAGFSEKQWNQDSFFDGQYGLVRGLIRFSDYEYVTHWMENYLEYYQTIMNLSLQNFSPSSSEYKNKKREIDDTIKKIKQFQLGRISTLIKELFGDIIQIKIVPNNKFSKHILVGPCIKEFFYDKPHVLWQKYGYEVDANWIVFCQINQACSSDFSKTFLPTGNQVDDSLENVLLSLDEIQKAATKVNFPVISITPLAIYRTNQNHLTKVISYN